MIFHTFEKLELDREGIMKRFFEELFLSWDKAGNEKPAQKTNKASAHETRLEKVRLRNDLTPSDASYLSHQLTRTTLLAQT